MDPDEAKAGKQVLAWFRIPISKRDAERRRAGEQFDSDRTRIVGTIVCLVYATVWLLGWTPASFWTGDLPSIFSINDQPPIPAVLPAWRGPGKWVPWGFAGLFTFLAAPFMRTQGRSAQWVSALGIFALCGEGTWLVLKSIVTLEGAISPGGAIVWVAVPLGIAAWVLLGPENPEAELQAEDARDRRASSLASVIIIGAACAFLFVLAILLLFRLPFP